MNLILLIMPRKGCYWTRKLELQLVEFVRKREYIWMPIGNTNHHIQKKYKAYAEFAAKLGKGFTARSVRDRWVNIRSTYHHNLRRIEKSKETAQSKSDIFVPCWPLWKPLQFLRNVDTNRKEYDYVDYKELQEGIGELTAVKEETPTVLRKRRKNARTDRPRRRTTLMQKQNPNKCNQVLDDLINAMKPLTDLPRSEHQTQSYWFFGKHVTERLNAMRDIDAASAREEIIKVLNEFKGKSELLSATDGDTT